MYKICTLIGTRPEIIKLSCVIKKIDKFFKQSLVHTGQNYNYELNEIFFKDLNLRKPDLFLNCADKNANLTLSNIFSKFDKALDKIKPDGVLILGDTNSGLASIVAKKKHINVFHIEAGNRCFDYKVPEEMNRKIIDHTSDINFTYTNLAKNYLIKEGIHPDRIIKVGSPMLEIIEQNKEKIRKSTIIKKLNLKEKNFFLISFHREENVDDISKVKIFFKLLSWLDKTYKKRIVVSTHFRTQKRISNILNNFKLKNKILFLNPFSFSDYIKLQQNCKVIFSDSGTLTEESSILQTNAIMLRESHERPEGMEEASVIMCGLNIKKIKTALKIMNIIDKKEIVRDYNVKNFSDKIVSNILSYLDYKINKSV